MKTKLAKISGLLCMALLMLASCSKDKSGDVRALLQTVPSDAGSVAVMNMEKVLKERGTRFEFKGSGAAKLNELLDGTKGVEVGYVVCFSEGFNTYITALLSNPEDFKKSLNGEQFVADNGVDISAHFAVKGNQVWYCLNKAPEAQKISSFASLSNNQSVLSRDFGEMLAECKHDFCAVGDIGALLTVMSQEDFRKGATARLASSLLFDDPAYLSAQCDLEKDGIEAELKVLNSKFKPAEFLWPTQKVDGKMITSLNGKCSSMIAIGMSNKLVDRLLSSSFAGAFPRDLVDAAKTIDGTLVAGFNTTKPSLDSISCMNIATNGKDTSALMQLLGNSLHGANVVKDGKVLTITVPDNNSGSLNPQDAAKLFKGAFAGFVSITPDNTTSVMLEPDGNGIEIKAHTTGKISIPVGR